MTRPFAVFHSALGRHYIDRATDPELQGRAERVYIPLQVRGGCSTFVVAIEDRMLHCPREPPSGATLICKARPNGRSACAMFAKRTSMSASAGPPRRLAISETPRAGLFDWIFVFGACAALAVRP